MISEQERWSRTFSGSDYFYGLEAGPVARRSVRYHLPLWKAHNDTEKPRALDVGCGEGQDLAFLAAHNYDALGVDFAKTGLDKAAKLLAYREVQARLEFADLTTWEPNNTFDLVLSVNSLQFVGEAAPRVLQKLQSWVAPGGVLGFSSWSRDNERRGALDDGLFRPTLDELMANFSDWSPLEAARLWQWSGTGEAQPFVTLIARRPE